MPGYHRDSEYVDAIRDGAQTTKEIADSVGVKRQSAYERLHSLEDKGKVSKEHIGNTLLWSVDGN